ARDQLSMAMRHEWAHRIAHDNLKRLLLLALLDVLPFVRGLGSIDRAWGRLAEWAADDRAVAGCSHRSLALAAALVRVARMGPPARPVEAAILLIADGSDLAVRVDRLLSPASYPDVSRAWIVTSVAFGALLAAAALRPDTLRAAYRLLEVL